MKYLEKHQIIQNEIGQIPELKEFQFETWTDERDGSSWIFKKETQYFLERLWCGAAMPAELNALYDDYIGEKEWQDDRGIYAAC